MPNLKFYLKLKFKFKERENIFQQYVLKMFSNFHLQIAIIDDDIASVLGIKIMVDYEGVTMNHFVQSTPTMIKKMVAVCQVRKNVASFIYTSPVC